MKLGRSLSRSPMLVSYLICLCVTTLVMVCWRAALFQRAECAFYDAVIPHRRAQDAQATGVVVVGIQESDIRAQGWPLDDRRLAALLDRLAAVHPSVIGMDLYRDLPEPRSGELAPWLADALIRHKEVVAIFNGDEANQIQPPGALATDLDRIGFNNFPADRDAQVVRRALLFSLPETGGTPLPSFAYQVVRRHLASKGVRPIWDFQTPRELELGLARLHAFGDSDGPYVHDDNMAGFQLLMDYRGARHVPVLSVADVMAPDADPRLLAGRIILIGVLAASVNDTVNIPGQAGRRGVLVHAQAVDQLLRLAAGEARSMRIWSEWAEGGWILAWCLLGKGLGLAVRKPWAFVGGLLTLLGVLTAASMVALLTDWWIPFTPAAVGVSACALTVLSYMSYQELLMRKVLMNLFSRQVSKDIAEDVWSRRDEFLDGMRPRAQKLTVTVLFTDLKGFSAISERLEPVQLFEWINGYLAEMVDIIQHHGGVLRQFTGDGTMAVFGVPAPHVTPEDQARDASNAVRCALAMGQRMVELNRRWATTGQPTTSMRVGIHTGAVAAGSIGSSDRFEYSVIGDVVNTASRLESYDKTLADPDRNPLWCRILIGAPTAEILEDAFELAPIGSIQVRGKVNSIAVFQVHGERLKPVGTL